MKHLHLLLLCLMLGLSSAQTHAHKRWFLPTDFSLSKAETITVDFSASNNIFYPDIAMPLDNVRALSPDGDELTLLNSNTGKRRSSFDVDIEKQGTHRILVNSAPIYFVSYHLPDQDEPQRARGYFEKLKENVPKQATNVRFMRVDTLIETYVTLGAETSWTDRVDTSGLAIQFLSHPNTQYRDEPATFRLMFNGKPAPGITVSVMPEGTRYRDEQADQLFVSNAEGYVDIHWQQAGRYLIEAETVQKSEDPEIQTQLYQYFLTLDVLAP